MASSPLPEVDEDVGDALDLWESASLDYPGRDIDEPNGWEFMDQHVSYEEPRYHSWHLWLGRIKWKKHKLYNSPCFILFMFIQVL